MLRKGHRTLSLLRDYDLHSYATDSRPCGLVLQCAFSAARLAEGVHFSQRLAMELGTSERRLKHYYLRKVCFNFRTRSAQANKILFLKRVEYLYSPYCDINAFEKGRLTALFNEYRQLLAKPKTHATGVTEVERLVQCVELPAVFSYADPFAGTRAIPNYLNQLSFASNDVKDEAGFDALSPGSWPVAFHNIDCYITSPPFAMLDVIVPDLYNRCKKLVCIHTSGDFVSNAPLYRQSFVGKLQSEGKVALVFGLENIIGRRCSWLLLFKCAKLRKKLLNTSCSFITTFSTPV